MASVIAFDEIGALFATYAVKSGGSITYDRTDEGNTPEFGRACSLSADSEVNLSADAERVIGRLVKVEKDPTYTYVCTVQVGGYMKLPAGDSATITRGKAIVGALGAASAKGYIRDVNTAVAAELGVMAGCVHDEAAQTAVVVKL
jgi:hypothetical protein